MIGSLNTQNRKATVVGAGIAGLLVSYYLDKAGYEVTLLEAKQNAGGLISTKKTPWGITEQAAHSFLATASVLKLCHELGVELLETKTRARYILRNGKLRRFPLNVLETLETLYRACLIPAISQDPQTMQQWADRHLGKTTTNYLISPFLAGIYAANPSEISIQAAFPRLNIKSPHSLLSWWWTQMRYTKHSSQMMAPKEGMGELIRKLSLHLEKKLGKRFIKSIEISSLPDAPNIILCTPAYQVAKLLDSVDPILSSHLNHIQYTPLISATVFLEKNSLPKEPCGIGVLMPLVEKRRCLGILFNSSSFNERVTDPEHIVSMTVMMGGSSHPEIINASEGQIQKLIFEELIDIIHIRKQPVHIVIHRQPKAIPQYSFQLGKALEAAKQGWCTTAGKILFGNYTGQISIRGMVEEADGLCGALI